MLPAFLVCLLAMLLGEAEKTDEKLVVVECVSPIKIRIGNEDYNSSRRMHRGGSIVGLKGASDCRS